MCVRSLVLAAALLAVAGCAVNVTVPSPGLEHPANPKAAAAPLPPLPTIPEVSKPMRGGMQGMKHGSTQGMDHGSMEDMSHGSMQGMQGTDHGAMQDMEETRATKRMDHGATHGMKGMEYGTMPGMDHGSIKGMKSMQREGMSDSGHSAHEHGDEHDPSAAGQPGDKSQVDRTIEVIAYDTMCYEPRSLTVQPGETIRFVVTNAGKIRHEFVIGTLGEQREHEQMMAQMPNMMHEDPNALTLEPGATKTLIWQFSYPGVVEFGCHVPGHYPAGMVGEVQVATARGSSEGESRTEINEMQEMDHDMEGMPHAH